MTQRTSPAWLLCCILAVAGCQVPPVDDSPNVLLVSIDTLRADHLSFYGYHRETSPYLASFARETAVFKNAYAHAPFTLTSHMSLFTSLSPAAHGVERDRRLGSGIPTLPQLLKAAGYTTLGLYTMHWLDPKFGFARGFDRYQYKQGRDELRQATLTALQDLAADREAPFFFFLHLRDVHCGPGLRHQGKPLYDSPPEFRDFFLPYPDIENHRVPEDIWENRAQLTEEEVANIIAQYDGGILYVDSVLRQTFELMKELDLFDNSLIVVTSDHGESLGSHEDFQNHGGFWQEGLRIPLIVKFPKRHPERERWRGTELENRVGTVDIAPTILKILGLPAPPGFQGDYLFDFLDKDIVAYRSGKQGTASALIRGNYKLILNDKYPSRTGLYDLAEDPLETKSILAENPDIAESMERMLRRHLRDHHRILEEHSELDNTEVELEDEQRRNLEALGYLH